MMNTSGFILPCLLILLFFSTPSYSVETALTSDFSWDDSQGGLLIELKDKFGQTSSLARFSPEEKRKWDLPGSNRGAQVRKDELKEQFNHLTSKGLIHLDRDGNPSLGTSSLSPDFRIIPATRGIQIRLLSASGERWVEFNPENMKSWVTNTGNQAIDKRHRDLQSQFSALLAQGYIRESHGTYESDTEVLSPDFRRRNNGVLELCLRNLDQQFPGAPCSRWVEFDPAIITKWTSSKNPRDIELLAQYQHLPTTCTPTSPASSSCDQLTSTPISAAKIAPILAAAGGGASGPRSSGTLHQTGSALAQFYTRDYTQGKPYSDHAPIIYGEIGTWNIAQQGQEFTPGSFNHKFINLENETDSQYEGRLQYIAEALKTMMRPPVHTFLLQELPWPKNGNFLSKLQEFLGKEYILTTDGGQGVLKKSDQPPIRNEKTRISQQIITNLGLKTGTTEYKTVQKLSPFYDSKQNKVYVSSHIPFDLPTPRLCQIMGEINKAAKSQYPSASVVILGDFNRPASNLLADSTCQTMNLGNIHSTHNEISYSAGIGGNNPQNIDLLIDLDHSLPLSSSNPPVISPTPSPTPSMSSGKTLTSSPGAEYKFYDSGSSSYFLTNFFDLTKSGGILIDGNRWPTSEHYYQAQKFKPGSKPFQSILAAKTPREAYSIGNDPAYASFKNPSFNTHKVRIMCKAVFEKFRQHTDLRTSLCSETGSSIIIEDSGDQDGFWGNGIYLGHGNPGANDKGQQTGAKQYIPGKNNHLGEILMSVRSELCGAPFPQQYQGKDIKNHCR